MSDSLGIVLYGSCYGSTQRYASALARLSGFDCASYRALSDQRTRESQLFLETYGKAVRFYDEGTLAPIAEFLRTLRV